MSDASNIINKKARDLKNVVEGSQTEQRNRLVIERDVIPIILIPGIMGSRLKNPKGKTVWDPDAMGFMLKNYGLFWLASSKNRKQRIIGDKYSPEHLKVLDDDEKQMKRIADPGKKDKTRKDRGWGGVFWGSYGPILKALQNRKWDATVNTFFEFPVHAFGYNWTASNDLAGKELAGTIDKLINDVYKKRNCKKVILVTHSMGGLVARSAYMLHGAKDKILGIVHGVQPSNGSPAAYWRMKGGFERPHSVPETTLMHWFKNPVKTLKHKTKSAFNSVRGTATAWTLGTDGEEVTALLGNMPGGLELLPNKQYKNNDGWDCWLEIIDEEGNRKALPKSDPYTDIYRVQDVYYRLVNPDWLNPGGKKKTSVEKVGPWDSYLENLDVAETFHDNLATGKLHPETYQFYSSGIASADRVVFKSVEDTLKNAIKRKLGLMADTSVDFVKDKATGIVPDILKGEVKSLLFKSGAGSVISGKAILIDVARKLMTNVLIKDSDWYSNRGGHRDRVDKEGKPAKEGALQLVTMQLPDGAGDGTVPESSAMALKLNADKRRTFCIADKREFESKAIEKNKRLKPKNPPDFDEGYFDRGHEPIYKTQSARFITFTAIENMCRTVIGAAVGAGSKTNNSVRKSAGGGKGHESKSGGGASGNW